MLSESEHGAGGRPRVALLSQRERQVLELIASGPTNKEIASTLGLRAGTVRGHVEMILRKLAVRNRTEAALLWQGRAK